ncbi:MAG: hypothetical protein BA861_01285 [Desulfobacterales bacterium S3730MH5]|nr:MAG: hypothetical protein BA861_01285 [Desulfobacterales bacterium S3730MH5]
MGDGQHVALPSSPVCLRLRGRLHDAQIKLNNHRPRNTWFGRYPCARIDHVFVDPSIEVVAMEEPNTELTRVACDHLPLIADVRIRHRVGGGHRCAEGVANRWLGAHPWMTTEKHRTLCR